MLICIPLRSLVKHVTLNLFSSLVDTEMEAQRNLVHIEAGVRHGSVRQRSRTQVS